MKTLHVWKEENQVLLGLCLEGLAVCTFICLVSSLALQMTVV